MEQTNSIELLTAQQVAEKLQISKQTIYQMKSEGRIPFVKIGNSLRFRPKDIEDWIRKSSHL